MKRTKALEAVAYHEAGHAVMCWCEGIGLKRVSIVPSKDFTGQVTHDRVFKRSDRPDEHIGLALKGRMERLARVMCAGPIAQRRHRPGSFRKHQAQSDWDLAADLALRLGGSGEIASAYIKLWDVQARAALDLWWRIVEAVALALLDSYELSGERAKRIIRAAMG